MCDSRRGVGNRCGVLENGKMITTRDGFLLLNSYSTPERIERVKGSMISRITNVEGKTLVTIGGEGWSIEVRETPDEVQEAVSRSYKEAQRR
jgi:hypothetical protein